jgi:hypothetical protein
MQTWEQLDVSIFCSGMDFDGGQSNVVHSHQHPQHLWAFPFDDCVFSIHSSVRREAQRTLISGGMARKTGRTSEKGRRHGRGKLPHIDRSHRNHGERGTVSVSAHQLACATVAQPSRAATPHHHLLATFPSCRASNRVALPRPRWVPAARAGQHRRRSRNLCGSVRLSPSAPPSEAPLPTSAPLVAATLILPIWRGF